MPGQRVEPPAAWSRRAFRGPVRRPVEPRPAGGHVDRTGVAEVAVFGVDEAEHLVVQLQIRDGDGREQGVLPVSVSLVTVPICALADAGVRDRAGDHEAGAGRGEGQGDGVRAPGRRKQGVDLDLRRPGVVPPRAVTVWVSKVTEVGSALPELPRRDSDDQQPVVGQLRQCAARKRSRPAGPGGRGHRVDGDRVLPTSMTRSFPRIQSEGEPGGDRPQREPGEVDGAARGGDQVVGLLAVLGVEPVRFSVPPTVAFPETVRWVTTVVEKFRLSVDAESRLKLAAGDSRVRKASVPPPLTVTAPVAVRLPWR